MNKPDCKEVDQPKWSFDLTKMECYKDYIYFGAISSINEKQLTVIVDNGNKYMKGQEIKFTVPK